MPLIYNEHTGEFDERRFDHLPKVENVRISPSDSVCVGDTITVYADLEDAEDLFLDGDTIPASFPIEILCSTIGTQRRKVVAKNDFGSQEVIVNYKVHPKPEIELASNPSKLHKGRDETAVLSWEVRKSVRVTLLRDGLDVKDNCWKTGTYEFRTETDSSFTIRAMALDARTIVDKTISVEVHPDATLSITVDKEYVFPNIPFTLKWNTTNALSVKLNGENVPSEGFRIYENGIDRENLYTLQVTDAFGIKEQALRVKMLPIPRIESLRVPMPDIEKRVDVNVVLNIPDFQVEIPTFDIKEVDLVQPEIYENGVDTSHTKMPTFVELQKLHTPSLWQKIENIISRILKR